MELDVAIVLTIGLSFLGLILLKVGKSYFAIEMVKTENNTVHQVEISKLETMLVSSENSNRNYIYKIRKMRDSYELDYDDYEYDESDELKLSDLASSIYPKLPPSVAKLIDKEEFQNAILKTVEKKPDIINTFIDKWLNKDGSTSNSTPKLKEVYN